MKNRIELSALEIIHRTFVTLGKFYHFFLKKKDNVLTNIMIMMLAALNVFLTLELVNPLINLVIIFFHVMTLLSLYMLGFKLDHDNNEKGSYDLAITMFTSLFLPSILIYSYFFIKMLF